jgi:mannose/fructose/N-acetylgalactosamine-specific phosphotransferase system component IID
MSNGKTSKDKLKKSFSGERRGCKQVVSKNSWCRTQMQSKLVMPIYLVPQIRKIFGYQKEEQLMSKTRICPACRGAKIIYYDGNPNFLWANASPVME